MTFRTSRFLLGSFAALVALGAGCASDGAACELTDAYAACPNVDVEGGECVGFSEECAQCFLDSPKDVCTQTEEITEDCQVECSQ